MAVELVVPGTDELAEVLAPVFRGFGDPGPTPELMEDQLAVHEPDRVLGARDGDEWVGATLAFSKEVTLPGGSVTPMAGVSMVGVSMTHRRQGVLTRLMERQLDDVAARGEVVAGLTASETNIYGRYGYGWAASAATYELDCDRSGFREPPQAGGRFRLLEASEAAVPVHEAFERSRRLRAGTVSRSPQWVACGSLLDRERDRDGGSALFVVVHVDDDGRPDGYLTYRVHQSWPDALPASVLAVEDLLGADAEIEAALWRFVADVDLTANVKVGTRPVDDPIRWRLDEPRRLRTKMLGDMLWLRVLDVPAAFGLRRYANPGGLVVEVLDRFRPSAGGRFEVEASADGAGVATRTGAEPDLVMGAEEIASLLLGGVSPTALAQARRIAERTPGALARADSLFVTAQAPFNPTHF